MDIGPHPRWTVSKIQLVVLGLLLLATVPSFSQQGGATGEPLVVQTTSLPKAYLRQPYQIQLQAKGGITPRKWEMTDQSLPVGLTLHQDGTLAGAPGVTGEFHFAVRVTDSGNPAVQRGQNLVLLVVAPLMVQWGRYPKVNGQRIEGSIKVSNQTEQDSDFTVIVLAVDETGRATAIGYQRFPLKKNAAEVEIPFGENLPHGAYEVNVDAVAEVADTNSIYRARLVPKEKLQVQQGP